MKKRTTWLLIASLSLWVFSTCSGGGRGTQEEIAAGSISEGGSCLTDDQCIRGLLCRGNVCASPSQDSGVRLTNERRDVGGACQTADECLVGLTCEGNVCTRPVAVTTPACGNRTIEAGEDCDDGNTTSGDLCSSSCHFETPAVTDDRTAPSFAGLSSATANTSGRVTLSWAAASDDRTPAGTIVYMIYKGTTPEVGFGASPPYLTMATEYVVTGLTPDTGYYFAVRARDRSGNVENNTIVRDMRTRPLPAPPTLIRPINGDTFKDTRPSFYWSDVPTAVSYTFRLSARDSFDEMIAYGDFIYPMTGISPASPPLGSGTYYWRVRTSDGDNVGSWSRVRKFAAGRAPADVNGDGYSDVIVGAPYANGGKGKAYVYFGGLTTGGLRSGAPDLTITGLSSGDHLGFSVALADINGDNFSDVIVGARDALYAGAPGTGTVYIFNGSATLMGSRTPTDASKTLHGREMGDLYGSAVAPAGDVNGDGYMDVIIGAPEAASSLDSESRRQSFGEASIVYGGDPLLGVTIIRGTSINGQFGGSVASAGDINDDGFSDIIIGAGNAGDIQRGQAYIYYGRADRPPSLSTTDANIVIYGDEDNDRLGYSVSSAMDVNRDGYSDVVIGAIFGGFGVGEGRAYIYYGGNELSATEMASGADTTLAGHSGGSRFGLSVSSAGDVNGDNYDDVIVGEPFIDSNSGKAYIYYGGGAIDLLGNLTLAPSVGDPRDPRVPREYYFGFAVSSAGDVNGDNFADVIVGMSNATAHGLGSGGFSVYHGGDPMDAVAESSWYGGSSGDRMGYSVSGAK